MSDTPIPSLANRVRHIEAGAPVVGVHFLRNTPVFVLGEEHLLLQRQDEVQRVKVHGGAILASTSDGVRIVTGGDDGKLVATNADGNHEVIATDSKKRWIDQVALGPDGTIAWSAGKTAQVLTIKGELRSFEAPSTVAGLCFAPKGLRLAIAHYNGAMLWFPNAAGATPQKFEWKGSHLGVSVSPDGKYLITTMQESTLHGWRITDAKNMRMSGYSARVRSLGWTADGNFLATSGSEQLILWPFDGKDGPMGKQPKMLAPSQARVAVVASHPKQPVVAAGYSDGSVVLVRLDDGALVRARDADGQPVTALGWNATGQILAYGAESGDAGVLVL
ncbi:MAG: WD40 repeat domain-containing protein [Pseudolabrys sp.]|nr:WD40 repeat domain-containing protein [Pseudolabrys sp.]MSP32334.1 WD40 repeat domain-containing protein [Pseudolabrys sp.]